MKNRNPSAWPIAQAARPIPAQRARTRDPRSAAQLRIGGPRREGPRAPAHFLKSPRSITKSIRSPYHFSYYQCFSKLTHGTSYLYHG